MAENTSNYILLELYIEYNANRDIIRDDDKSWQISYEKDENCFFCKNLSDNNVTKMNDVENFIRIWIRHTELMLRDKYSGQKAVVMLIVQGKCLSGYKCHMHSKIPENICHHFPNTLKDII
ncbi:hypothetical protein BD770DRAFT_414775 [Pilaira anomala]|nr:hypothetical protein BD770DRAFT_414775 [Pilaira anomala]